MFGTLLTIIIQFEFLLSVTLADSIAILSLITIVINNASVIGFCRETKLNYEKVAKMKRALERIFV